MKLYPNKTKIIWRRLQQSRHRVKKPEHGSPSGKPFTYLWIANCVLYSVVITYLLYKGLKKQRITSQSHKPDSCIEKWKKDYKEKVVETRRKIYITKAEWERLKENRKITKKGRKNRAISQEECKTISSAIIVNYNMEKKKSLLRKLKKGFCRRKKQEEARSLNRQFRQEPNRVYINVADILSKDELNQRSKYNDPSNTTQNEESGKREGLETRMQIDLKSWNRQFPDVYRPLQRKAGRWRQLGLWKFLWRKETGVHRDLIDWPISGGSGPTLYTQIWLQLSWPSRNIPRGILGGSRREKRSSLLNLDSFLVRINGLLPA